MKPFIFVKNINSNGRNWPGIVFINPETLYPAAILAQEWYESIFKLNPWNFIRTRIFESHRREMEIIGHEIEVQAANLIYNVSSTKYRNFEAQVMREGYDGLFMNMSHSEIVKKMKNESDFAFNWVSDRLEDLKEYKNI